MPQTGTTSLTIQSLEFLRRQVPADPRLAGLNLCVGTLARGDFIAR